MESVPSSGRTDLDIVELQDPKVCSLVTLIKFVSWMERIPMRKGKMWWSQFLSFARHVVSQMSIFELLTKTGGKLCLTVASPWPILWD